MAIHDQLKQHRDEIRRIAAANGAHNLRLFGSVARGEESASSDVDILVSLEPGRTLLDLARLEARLEQLLGRPVDVVTEASLRDSIRRPALREAIGV